MTRGKPESLDKLTSWSVADGSFEESIQLDPNRKLKADETMRQTFSDESIKRLLAYETVMYAIELIDPRLFESPTLAEQVKADVASAAVLCAQYSKEQLTNDLPALTREFKENKPPIFQAINVLHNSKLINDDTKRVSRGTVRILHIRQKGEESMLPKPARYH